MTGATLKPWEPGEGPQRYIRELEAEVERLMTREQLAELAALAELEAMIEGQRKQIDRYGVALMMIAEGCSDPCAVARRALEPKP